MISAPKVNHSRFFSSVALEKLAKLRFAAIFSAADAMLLPDHQNGDTPGRSNGKTPRKAIR
jgi:hypothetical protein